MRRHKSDRVIGILTIFLMGLGLIVIYAIGPMRANVMNSTYGTDYSDNYFFIRQAISVILAVGAFFALYKIPYHKVRLIAKWLVWVGLALCVILAILALVGSSLANCQLGACRWFNIGGVSLQPAEIVKFGLILYLAQLVASCKREGTFGKFKSFWLPLLIVSGLSLFFVVVVQSDLGTGISMVAIILAMLFVGGLPMRQFLIMLAILVAGGLLVTVTSPHRMERITTFIGGDSSNSYHIENAMIAIGTGGLFGVGVGNSVQATGYLPESINDSIFAVMGETFGLFGLLVIVTCFTVLLYRLLRTSQMLPQESEERLVVAGIFAWMAAHVLLNIATMIGLVPVTGITLPLLSYGGTSMVFIAGALGLCLQLSCYTGREVQNESISSRRGLRRAHYSGRRSDS